MSFKPKKFLFVLVGIAALSLILHQPAHANPRYAALVVDAKTGKTLFSRYADAQRYPASLTKMMTLFVMFEELEAGRMSLNTKLKVSARAAARPPTKIGVKAGGTLRAETAIRALAVRSANDVAVVVAENISGSESNFAQRMTRTARAIGMKNTTFKNASGLPNSKQVTTARDMALLGRALNDRFPQYFKYFSTRSFSYGGRTYRNTNRLLGAVNGVNGIKTGYTKASGFNLVTSVERDGRHVVAVVMGGRSSASRNAHMIDLIKTHTKKAKRGRRTAPLLVAGTGYVPPVPPKPLARPVLVTDASQPARSQQVAQVPIPETRDAAPLVVASAAPVNVAPLPYAKSEARLPRAHTPIARLVKTTTIAPNGTISETSNPIEIAPIATEEPQNLAKPPSTNLTAALGPSHNDPIAARIFEANEVAELADMGAPAKTDRIAQLAKLSAGKGDTQDTAIAPVQVAAVAQVSVTSDAYSPPIPGSKQVAQTTSKPRTGRALEPLASGSDLVAVPQSSKPMGRAITPSLQDPPPGWHIQIGAMPTQDDALQLIEKAKSKASDVVASVDPFTMEVDKNGTTLYRARFAGFSGKKEARAACVRLKKRSFDCLAVPK